MAGELQEIGAMAEWVLAPLLALYCKSLPFTAGSWMEYREDKVWGGFGEFKVLVVGGTGWKCAPLPTISS